LVFTRSRRRVAKGDLRVGLRGEIRVEIRVAKGERDRADLNLRVGLRGNLRGEIRVEIRGDLRVRVRKGDLLMCLRNFIRVRFIV